SQPCRVARPQTFHGTSLQRNSRSGRDPQYDSGHCYDVDWSSDGLLATLKEEFSCESNRHGVRWHSRPGRRGDLEPLVPYQQESLDQFIRAFQRRLRAGLPRTSLLDTGDQEVERHLDYADPRLWNECDCRLRCRLIRLRPGLLVHREGPQWAGNVARRGPSQAGVSGRKRAQCFADLFSCSCFLLLDPAVVPLAETDFPQGVTASFTPTGVAQ